MLFKYILVIAFFLYLATGIGKCEKICSWPNEAGCVALTFDDGPSEKTTGKILTILARYDARGTFFVSGKNALLHPEIVREIDRRGHEVGNHTYDHPRLTEHDEFYISQQIATTQEIIFGITGYRPKVFRPPFSAIDAQRERVVESFDLKDIFWSISPADWLNPLAELIAERVLENIKAGDIVVMHDGNFPEIDDDSSHQNTVTALPLILEGLAKRGLKSVTVSELIAEK